MTNIFDELDKFAVGFTDQLQMYDKLRKQTTGYPPYNIIKVDDTHYKIEVALAGFKIDDIDIELKDRLLTISTNITEKQESYLFKGIANRAFSRSFIVEEFIEVKSAHFENGILSIILEKQLPENKKSTRIKIEQ